MQRAYLMAGKRFQVKNVNYLNKALTRYNLISHLEDIGGGIGSYSARRLSDPVFTHRYRICHSYGDIADFEDYDLCIGKIIESTEEVARAELPEIEKILLEVKEDIPDAEILLFSNWV